MENNFFKAKLLGKAPQFRNWIRGINPGNDVEAGGERLFGRNCVRELAPGMCYFITSFPRMYTLPRFKSRIILATWYFLPLAPTQSLSIRVPF